MEIQTFRHRLFYLLLITKLIVFLWLMILWIAHAYTVAQFRELLLLITPLFVTNITVAIKFFLEDRKKSHEKEPPPVTQPLRVVVFWGTILYGLFMVFLLTYFSTLTGDQEAYSNLKELISLGEILFGGYIGLVVMDLFDRG